MTKQIVVLSPDGRTEILDTVPNLATLQALVGGYVEAVRVLDRLEDMRPVYSYMYVNETGLNDGLPRNEAATALYQRNVRLAYAEEPDPFDAAARAAAARRPAGAFVVDLAADIPGYASDPWIAGVAVYYEGYTCEEIDRGRR
jgi:hypothetical protein